MSVRNHLNEQEKLGKIKVGQIAPDFEAMDINDNTVNLKKLIEEKKTILLFYRGSWCPRCNIQLANLSRDYSKFKNLNTQIIAVSNESIDKGKILIEKKDLPFILLSDPKLEGIDIYDVRVKNRDMYARMKRQEIFAIPAIFIIDKKGIIRYSYIGKNYRDRPKNDKLLAILKEIN